MQRKLLNTLQRAISGVERTRRRVESLYAADRLVKRDLDIVYAGLFIRSVTLFEAFVEELFFAVLAGRTRRSVYAAKQVFPELRSFPASRIRLILLGDRKYFEWLPYSHTEKRSRTFLSGSTPFAALAAPDKASLEKVVYTRNALAHSSSHARHVFAEIVVAGLPLPPREQTPLGYLRSLYRTTPDVTRFEFHNSELLRIAVLLAS